MTTQKKDIITVIIPSKWQRKMNAGDIRPGKVVAIAEVRRG